VPQVGIEKLVKVTPVSLGFIVDILNYLMGVINPRTQPGGHHFVQSIVFHGMINEAVKIPLLIDCYRE